METLVPSSRGAASTQAPISRIVYGALVRVLGRERAQIVDFYVDSRLAASDPERYERALEGLLGGEGGRLVIRGIKSELGRSGRVECVESESFYGHVKAVESALIRSSNGQ